MWNALKTIIHYPTRSLWRENDEPQWRFTGYAQGESKIAYFREQVLDFKSFNSPHHEIPLGIKEAKLWAHQVMPRPELNECTLQLIKEEAMLETQTKDDVMREIATWNEMVEEEEGAIQLEESLSGPRQAMENHRFDVLENAVLCGAREPDRYCQFADHNKTYLFNEHSKILTYQVIIRTVLRVNERSKVYRATTAGGLSSSLEDIVTGYLGETSMPAWYNK